LSKPVFNHTSMKLITAGIACLLCSFVVKANINKADTTRIPLPGSGISHPIRFLTFNAVRNNEQVNIQFTTPSESITSVYYLERSENGNDWEIITSLPTLSNLNPVNKYQYIDKNNLKLVYYRVKQLYQSGMYSYSPIVYAKNKSQHESIKISGLTNGSIAVFFPEEIKTNVQVRMQSLNGLLLMDQLLVKPSGYIILQTPVHVKGMATVTLTNGELVNQSRLVVLL
jgi:hypothetical protein